MQQTNYFVQVSRLSHNTCTYFYIYTDATSLKRILSYLSLVCYKAVFSVVTQGRSVEIKNGSVAD